ncbi:MAG: xylan 1,4-beta-xylosidase [Ruminiclostridium sp.]|nr:xylan 1,4-beta-xylosidase [Ruminiclostridium sp.]
MERFVKMYTQGNPLTSGKIEILVDTATGVNYLFRQSGYSGGLTPLLDKDGKPIVTPLTPNQNQ